MNRPNRRIHCGTARYRESSDQMNAGLHCGTSRPVDILRVPTVGLLIECSRASAISAVNNPSGDVARCDRRQGGVLYGDGSVFGDTLISPTNILLSRFGVSITDFGDLSKVNYSDNSPSATPTTPAANSNSLVKQNLCIHVFCPRLLPAKLTAKARH